MTVVAVALALVAAIVFGIAAVNQHHGVRRTLEQHRRHLALSQVTALVSDRSWLRGFVLMALGTVCHVAALSLAPISLTQPINVLAVPTTILAGAVIARRRPALSLMLAAGAVVLGVGSFVLVLSGTSAGNIPTPGLLGWVGAAVLVLTVGLHLAARRLLHATHDVAAHPDRAGSPHHRPSWLAPVLLGIAGALCFGTTSSTFRLLAQDFSHAQPLPAGVAIALICFVPVGLAAGAWSIQQAYAAGAAPAVTATSALTDPIVALTIGMAVLGETPQLSGWRLLVLIAAAALAATGVIHLARHEDDIGPGRTGPSPVSRSPRRRGPLLLQTTTPVKAETTYAYPARR